MGMRKVVLIVLVSLTCGYVIYSAIGFFYSVHKLKEHNQIEHVFTVDTTVSEYLSLFTPSIFSDGHRGFSYIMNLRAPFSTFDIKGDNCIIASRLSASIGLSLRDIKIESRAVNDGTLDSFYNVINENYFKLSHLCSSPGPIQAVYLTVDGEHSDRTSINDSTLKIHGYLSSFSISYKSRGPIDIYAQVKGQKLPMDIYFLQRSRALYFVLVSLNSLDSGKLVDLF